MRKAHVCVVFYPHLYCFTCCFSHTLQVVLVSQGAKCNLLHQHRSSCDTPPKQRRLCSVPACGLIPQLSYLNLTWLPTGVVFFFFLHLHVCLYLADWCYYDVMTVLLWKVIMLPIIYSFQRCKQTYGLFITKQTTEDVLLHLLDCAVQHF